MKHVVSDPMDELISLEERILEVVRQWPKLAFNELAREIPGHFSGGEFEYGLLSQNIVFWCGLSRVGALAIHFLSSSGRVVAEHVPLLDYFAAGDPLSLPIAKQPRRTYKKPHWLPVLLSTKEQINARRYSR